MSNNDSTGSESKGAKVTKDAVGKVRKSADRKNTAVRRVAQAADTGDKRDRSVSNRLGFPAIVGLVTLLGLALVIYAKSQRDPIAQPAVGKDHWHAAYGFWDCTQNDGDGAYLPAFQSQVDEVGIHSHQDGIMHVHPWFERSDGPEAVVEHFFESMQVAVDDDRIVLNNGQVLQEGTMCNGEEAVVHMRKWQFWIEAERGDAPETVFTENIGQVQYLNDREVYVIAFAPLDAEIPALPLERFNTLELVSPDLLSARPDAPVEEQNFVAPVGPEVNLEGETEAVPAGDAGTGDGG